MKTYRPRILICSSTNAIKKYLEPDKKFKVDIWDEGTFSASKITIQALEQAILDYDFAIIVLTPDLEVVNRDKR